MNKEIQSLTEQRFAAGQAQRDAVLEAWTPTIDKASEFFTKETGKTISPWMRKQIAQVMENSVLDAKARGMHSIFETTVGTDISYLGVQLPIVMALLPSSVLPEIMVVQAMERRIAQVFFANINAGTTKGSITKGDPLVSSRTGMSNTTAVKQYPSEFVTNEPQGTSTSGTLVQGAPVPLTSFSCVARKR